MIWYCMKRPDSKRRQLIIAALQLDQQYRSTFLFLCNSAIVFAPVNYLLTRVSSRSSGQHTCNQYIQHQFAHRLPSLIMIRNVRENLIMVQPLPSKGTSHLSHQPTITSPRRCSRGKITHNVPTQEGTLFSHHHIPTISVFHK